MAQQPRKRAPSLLLVYNCTNPGDILMQEVFVPASGLAKCDYYCSLCWNRGMEGGGFCGIQDHPDGQAFIFTIWHPQVVKAIPIAPVFKGPGWKENQWYTMVVRRWGAAHGQATRFGGWVLDQKADTWTHLITMEYPVPQVYFSGDTIMYREDWGFTSEHDRCVNMHDVEDTFEDNDRESCPSKQPIKLRKVELRGKLLMWETEKSSTPQFGYRVNVGNQELCCGYGESVTGVRLDKLFQGNAGKYSIVVVEVEDILGNCDQQLCPFPR